MDQPPLGPLVRADLTGKVVIITGANTGLGFEASKHVATMNPGKLIMTARDEAKGNKAVQRVKDETGCKNVELGILDQASLASVKAFADKVIAENERLDLISENAGLNLEKYSLTKDGYETELQVNVISPAILTVLLLPLLKKTAAAHPSSPPRISIVSSGGHHFTTLDDEIINSSSIFELLSKEDYSNRVFDGPPVHPWAAKNMMERRYFDTKLFNVFWANHLHSILSPTIVVNAIDPGFCRSEITRNITGERATMLAAAEEALAYTTEEGGRSIVYGLTGEGTDGKFVKCMAVDDPSEFSRSDVGKKVQNQLWLEIKQVLSRIDESAVGNL